MKKTAVTTSILVLTGLLFAAPGAWADGYGHGRYDGYSQQHERGARDYGWGYGWNGARAAGALFGGIVLGMAAMQSDHGYAHWGEHHREDRGAYYRDHHRNDRRIRHAWSYRSTMPQRDSQRFAYHRGYHHDYHYRDRQAYRSHDRYEYRRYGERGDDR